jgi:hypothetical protein
MAAHDKRLEYTREELERLALTDNPIKRLVLGTSDWAPLQHLEQAGMLKISGDDMVDKSNWFREQHAQEMKEMPPMHLELDAAARKAAEAATAALAAAVEAAYQLYRVTQLCDCNQCRQRRQRRNAKSN